MLYIARGDLKLLLTISYCFQITRIVRGSQVRHSSGRTRRPDGWNYGKHKHPTGPDHMRQNDRQNVRHDVHCHVHGTAGVASGKFLALIKKKFF